MEPISKHERNAQSGEPSKRRLPLARTPLEKGGPQARSGREISRRRVPLFAVVAVALSVLATAACGGAVGGSAYAANTKAGQEADGQESAPTAEKIASAGPQGDEHDKVGARAGEAVAGADGGAAVRAGNVKAGTGGVEISGNSRGGAGEKTETKGGPQEVTLEITGDPGTGFSGVCSVGGSERTLDGEVPGRYVFEPQGKRLECELRKEGGSALGIVVTDGAGGRSEQRTTGGESTVRFVYSSGSVSSSISSSTVSESQTVTSSDGSSSEGYR